MTTDRDDVAIILNDFAIVLDRTSSLDEERQAFVHAKAAISASLASAIDGVITKLSFHIGIPKEVLEGYLEAKDGHV